MSKVFSIRIDTKPTISIKKWDVISYGYNQKATVIRVAEKGELTLHYLKESKWKAINYINHQILRFRVYIGDNFKWLICQ